MRYYHIYLGLMLMAVISNSCFLHRWCREDGHIEHYTAYVACDSSIGTTKNKCTQILQTPDKPFLFSIVPKAVSLKHEVLTELMVQRSDKIRTTTRTRVATRVVTTGDNCSNVNNNISSEISSGSSNSSLFQYISSTRTTTITNNDDDNDHNNGNSGSSIFK